MSLLRIEPPMSLAGILDHASLLDPDLLSDLELEEVHDIVHPVRTPRQHPRRFLFGLGSFAYLAVPNDPAVLVPGYPVAIPTVRGNLFARITELLRAPMPSLSGLGNCLLAYWYLSELPSIADVDAVVVRREYRIHNLRDGSVRTMGTQGWRGFARRMRGRNKSRVPVLDFGSGEIKLAMPIGGADGYDVRSYKGAGLAFADVNGGPRRICMLPSIHNFAP